MLTTVMGKKTRFPQKNIRFPTLELAEEDTRLSNES